MSEPPTMTSRCPYPGLRPFQPEEADLFFGRNEQIRELRRRLEHSKFLAVVGESGCGKSSLILAGLIPEIEAGFLTSAGSSWIVATFRPGSHPLRKMAATLLKSGALSRASEIEGEDVALVEAALRRGPLGLIELFQSSRNRSGENLLLVVDQFEEIFRFRRAEEIQEGADTPIDREEATAFVALLLRTVKDENVPIYVVLTMRSDFLGDCAFFADLPEALNEGQFLTPRLSFEQRRAAIEGPARVEEGQVAPDLTLRLLNDMGTGPDQLPLMQHALMRVWTMAHARDPSTPPTLTHRDYLDVGGLEQALSLHADSAYDKLTDTQKAIAERLFRALSGGNTGRRDTRRPTKLGMIADAAGVKPEAVAEVVEFFRGGDLNLLTPARGPLVRDTTIDISHESLIRQWTRLKDWVKMEASSADTYRLLAQTASRWSERTGGDLWTGHNLDSVIEWQEQEKPNEVWASRYGGGFSSALWFIEASKEKRRQDQREKELAERRELLSRWRGRLAVGAGIGLVVAMGLAFWALAERSVAKKNLAAAISAEEMAAKAEQNAKIEAHRANENAEDAKMKRALAERQTALANSLILASKAQNLSTGFPVLSILLTSEALKTAQRENQVNVEAENVLRRTLTRMGGFALSNDRGEIDVVNSVAFSLDGKTLAYGYSGHEGNGGIMLWDVASEHRTREPVGVTGAVYSVAFSPDGKILASAGGDKTVRLSEAATGRALVELKGHESAVNSVAFSPDGKILASAGGDKTVRLWEAATGEATGTLKGHESSVNSVAFSPDGKTLASASNDYTIRLWEAATGEATRILMGHTSPVNSVAFSPDGSILASAGNDDLIRLWKAATGECTRILQGHDGAVFSVAFSRHGRILASASNDDTVRFWDTATGEARLRLQGGENNVRSVAFALDARTIAAATGATVRLWDMSSLAGAIAEPVTLGSATDPLQGTVTASRDGKWIIEASSNRARLWPFSTKAGTNVSPILLDLSAISTSVKNDPRPLETAFTEDGRHVFVLGDRGLGVWNCKYPGEDKPFLVSANHPESPYRAPIWSQDGRWLCLRSGASQVLLFDLEGTSPPYALNFKPSSAMLEQNPRPDKATSLKVDVGSKGFIGDQSSKTQGVSAPSDKLQSDSIGVGIAFSPDHRWLAITDHSKTVVVWDLNAKNPPEATFALEAKQVVAGIVFHPKTPWLFATCHDPVEMAVEVVSWKLDLDGKKWTDDLNFPMRPEPTGTGKSKTSQVAILDFSPDGRTLSIRRDGWLEIVDLPEKSTDRAQSRASYAASPSAVPLQYSPDSNWLFAPASGVTSQLFPLKKQPMSLQASPGMSGPASRADFSRESRWLATTGNDDTVRVWDVNVIGKQRSPDESDPLPRVLPSLARPMRVVRFDAEARRLVTVAGDGVIRVWTLDNDELLRIAARTAGRNLTRQEWNQYFPRQEYHRTFEEFAEPPGVVKSPPAARRGRGE